MIDRSYLGPDRDTTESKTSVPKLHEVKSEREFANHIMLYGYTESEVEQLSEQQFMWLRRWG